MSQEKNEEDVLESSKAREIVQEVLNFGVSQFQIKKVIKFLSLELEDRSLMIRLLEAIDEEDKITTNKIEI